MQLAAMYLEIILNTRRISFIPGVDRKFPILPTSRDLTSLHYYYTLSEFFEQHKTEMKSEVVSRFDRLHSKTMPSSCQ